MRTAISIAVLLIALSNSPASRADAVDWKAIAAGMELGWIVAKSPSTVGDSRIAVVRIDPGAWELELVSRSQTGEATGHTAREWARIHDFVLATNAGMFGSDFLTHIGYMEYRGHVNPRGINSYQSVAAFDPRDPKKDPPFRIFDLDAPGITIESIRRDYASLVQNLRLIKRPGANRWSEQARKWSEAALGEDTEGRILFVFSRSPFSMRTINGELLSAGIGLVALQHLEGGPEAQIYLHVGDIELEALGSYESSYEEDDGNTIAWPIPNVLGVKKRAVAN